jgi:hypothetical protein
VVLADVLRGDAGEIDLDRVPARTLIHTCFVAIPQAIRPAG